MTTHPLQFKDLPTGGYTADVTHPEDKVRFEMLEKHRKETDALREELRIANELVDQFAVLLAETKYEYSVELGKLNKEHAAMRQHCETINEQLKAAQDEIARLRKLKGWGL